MVIKHIEDHIATVQNHKKLSDLI